MIALLNRLVNTCAMRFRSAMTKVPCGSSFRNLNRRPFAISSMFSMKPILKASEIDDSRPTVIRRHSVNPTFISVLSGKINTVYDLDEVLTI